MGYQSWINVFVIILILNAFQNTVVSGQNIGLMMRNFSHLSTNETCGSGGANCRYYMDLCFSFSEKLDCSIFTLKTKSWVVRPGKSQIFKLGTGVATNVVNPLRVSLKKWTGQKVVLQANISKSGTPPIFMERLQISGTLPFPINELAKLRDEDWKKITKCGSKFCLGVTFYMWCDDINGCVATSSILPTTSIPPTTRRIISSTSKLEITQTASTVERARTSNSPIYSILSTNTRITPSTGELEITLTASTVERTSTSTTSSSSIHSLSSTMKKTPSSTKLETSPTASTAERTSTSTISNSPIHSLSSTIKKTTPSTTKLETSPTASTVERTSTSTISNSPIYSLSSTIKKTRPSTTKLETSPTASTAERTSTSTISNSPIHSLSSTIKKTISKPGISSTILKVETQPSTISPVTSIAPTGPENPKSAKTSKTNVVKSWWFWFIMALVVLFILLLVLMVIRRERKRRRVPITTTLEKNHGNDVEERDACGKNEITMNPMNAYM